MLLRVSAAFFSLLSLKYLYISFSVLSLLPACCCVPLLRSPGARPSASLSPPLPSCLPSLPASPPFLPSLRLSSAPAPTVCSVAAVCRLVCPLPPPRPRGLFRPAFCVFIPSGAPLKLPGGLLCVVPCVLWWLPSLVRHQAQNGVTVWADAPRIYPRPDLLLPMCCRVFRGLIRVLFRGFRVCVSCCLLPAVVWW